MMDVHRLTPAVFDAIATGDGGPDGIRELRAAQYSKHLLLINHLLDPAHGPDDGLRDLLERARVAAPERFREVISAPLVGGWTAIAARAANRGTLARGDRDHLAAIAIVAAAAAGVDGAVRVPVHDGRAVLPGLGAIIAGQASYVPVHTAGGKLFATTDTPVPAGPGVEAPGWEPLRVLTATSAGLTIRLGLDDLHPYRHGHHAPPALRLPAADVASWRALFAAAWDLLARRAPQRAAELIAGLRTLVPLVQTDPGSARSATIRHAFGVFGLTRPPTAADFAVTLVHEFQHSKLSGLLDIVPLTDPADDRTYFAPWREDPRPLPGLLQGVYAFAGVADVWQSLRDTVEVATVRFAESRLQVDRGLAAIEGSGALTVDGERLVAGLRRTTDRLLAVSLPPAADAAARAGLSATWAAWQDRNRR